MNKLIHRRRITTAGFYLASLFTATHTYATVASPCDFSLQSGKYASWPGASLGWVQLQNASATSATRFSVFLDLNGASISEGHLASFQPYDGGYMVTQPAWLEWQSIPPNTEYRWQFISNTENVKITPYLLSVNGEACDVSPPQISVDVSHAFVTQPTAMQLHASAEDDTAVLKVVFKLNDDIIAVDREAPFSAEIPLDAQLNGRQQVSATVYDPSGNTASAESSVLVAIGNKFFGSAVEQERDLDDFLTHFNQLTPGNSGKWGSVEAVRDQMNWQALDAHYGFAKTHNLPFKMHTLIWGQQQPGWLNQLSPQEQRQEIEEWMAAVANRYPDIDLIDVVNEPVNAPPAYREALGGDGDSGWDWLITAFQLARQYFPEAELITNEYNVLIFNQFTENYLQVLSELQQRNLLDGIGVQAHFLEQAEMAEVERNLQRLAETGLPIYVSELDINFANDARQAQRLSQLFTLFWQHPSVLGVTHWGYNQGAMWRNDAYLVNADGSYRPSLTWLKCFMQGEANCPLPDYIPAPRSGNAAGLTLEAEDFDSAEGVLALGNIVAYIDQGDTITYERVQFDPQWNTLQVRYAKGNESEGILEVHIDQVDQTPLVRVALPNTGGWGQSNTLEVPWEALAGEHRVILVFSNAYGIGNIDRFAFIDSDANLGSDNVLSNGDFEQTSTAGWITWDGILSIDNSFAYSGEQSLRLSNRSGNGPAAAALTSLVTSGVSYSVSFWVSIAGAEEAPINLTHKLQCNGEAASYGWIVAPQPVVAGEWRQLSGTLEVPDCPLADVLVYAEGPAGGVDLYIDNVVIRPE